MTKPIDDYQYLALRAIGHALEDSKRCFYPSYDRKSDGTSILETHGTAFQIVVASDQKHPCDVIYQGTYRRGAGGYWPRPVTISNDFRNRYTLRHDYDPADAMSIALILKQCERLMRRGTDLAHCLDDRDYDNIAFERAKIGIARMHAIDLDDAPRDYSGIVHRALRKIQFIELRALVERDERDHPEDLS